MLLVSVSILVYLVVLFIVLFLIIISLVCKISQMSFCILFCLQGNLSLVVMLLCISISVLFAAKFSSTLHGATRHKRAKILPFDDKVLYGNVELHILWFSFLYLGKTICSLQQMFLVYTLPTVSSSAVVKMSAMVVSTIFFIVNCLVCNRSQMSLLYWHSLICSFL